MVLESEFDKKSESSMGYVLKTDDDDYGMWIFHFICNFQHIFTSLTTFWTRKPIIFIGRRHKHIM
jgi:hypothetical protein